VASRLHICSVQTSCSQVNVSKVDLDTAVLALLAGSVEYAFRATLCRFARRDERRIRINHRRRVLVLASMTA
jgi:hypothetical protein